MASDIDDDEVNDVAEGIDNDILDLSDEEFLKLSPAQIAEASTSKAEPVAEAQAVATGESEEEDDSSDDSTNIEDEDEDPAALAEGDTDESSKESEDPQTESKDGSKPKEKAKAEDKGEIDYKMEYEKLLEPFKANGRQIQVDNVADAKTLMMMGANYNKKMAALKPNLKIVKMLDTAGLLDEAKINHLIDLASHDAGAVAKLLKDAKIDPLDVDTTQEVDYKPKNHSVPDSQFELDQVLEELKDNESFPKTIDVISNQWDEKSKKLALNDPRIITVIDEQIQSGVYDQIVTVMERERMVGRMTDVSDLEAYRSIGEHLAQQGKLVNQQRPATQTGATDSEGDLEAKAKREGKRKAVASTKKTIPKQNASNFNPLEMSDEEFMKQAASGVFR